ncbi:MAG: gamma-glutamyltransferase, partial [Actinomycetota bacterium]|nr:gamma-glutamyltransferase [Actinomycetota bacterium]
MGTRIAVAASSELATAAGVRLAESGGNAVDAALAAVLVAMVCEPGVCAPAGGAFVTIAPADGSAPVTVERRHVGRNDDAGVKHRSHSEHQGSRGCPSRRFRSSVHHSSAGPVKSS